MCEKKIVVFQHPFDSGNSCAQQIEWEVYPFNNKSIYKNVPDDIGCGNYRLGEVDEEGRFFVFYVGRATDEKLKKRIADHIKEYENRPNVYFSFEAKKTDVEAYNQECKDYHSFFDGDDGFLENKEHPAKPFGSSQICIFCKQ